MVGSGRVTADTCFPIKCKSCFRKGGGGAARLMLGLQTIVGDKRDGPGEGRKNSINELWNREEGRRQDAERT